MHSVTNICKKHTYLQQDRFVNIVQHEFQLLLVFLAIVLFVGTCVCSPVSSKGDTGELEIGKRFTSYYTANFFCGITGCSNVCKTYSVNEWYCCNCGGGGGGGCFPSMAKVQLEDGKSVRMSELQIGNQVQTVAPGGRLQYSEVLTFLSKNEDVTALYMSITTSLNNTIHLSSNHLIYAKKSFNDKFTPIYAGKALIGDDVLTNGNDELSLEKVTNLSSYRMQGFHVPLTADGNIVVNGVLASCYASFDHDLADLAMVPMQWYPKMTEWIFGVTNGTPDYVNFAKGFGRWVLPSVLLYGKSD